MRERTLFIVGTLTVLGGVFALALWLSSGAKPDPEQTPEPAVTVSAGPAPTAPPTSEPAPAETVEPGEDPEEAHDHNHGDEAPPEDCTGPVGCTGDDISRNTQEDIDAAAAVRERVAPFVAEWTTVSSAESEEDRKARLIRAGATPEAADGTSTLARANTVQTGLTVSTTPRAVQRTLFLGRDGGLLKFQASLDVDATYMQPDDSGSVHVAGGAVYIYLTDAGAIAKVTDSFPTIERMR